LSVGAQPTDPVQRLLVKQGTIDRLSRLRKGEAREDLVAEYLGVEEEEGAEEIPAPEPSATVEEPLAVAEAAMVVDEEE
jgi:hypothetical protein